MKNNLETPELPEQQEEKRLARVEKESPLRKLGLRKKLAFTAALFGAANAYTEESQANTVEAESSIERREDVERGTKERFGVSIYDVCNKAGCEVVTEVPSENGKYLLVFGQVHARTPLETEILGNTTEVIDSQEIIYESLNQLNNPTVIDEGTFTSGRGTIPSTEIEALKKVASLQTRIAEDKNAFGIKEYHNYLLKRFNLKSIQSVSEVYTPTEDERLFLEQTLQEIKPLNDAQLSDYIDQNYCQAGCPDSARNMVRVGLEDFRKRDQNFQGFSFRLPIENIEERVLFTLGATKKLLIDGKQMNVLAGDSEETHTTLDKAEESEGGSQESTERDKAHNRREDFAVRQAMQSGDTHPIIIYGAAHSFVNNINNTGYGVIRVRTSIDTSVDGSID